ncbi:MAG: hypothetical protein AABZ30_06750 [Myxococcota bacterium]
MSLDGPCVTQRRIILARAIGESERNERAPKIVLASAAKTEAIEILVESPRALYPHPDGGVLRNTSRSD